MHEPTDTESDTNDAEAELLISIWAELDLAAELSVSDQAVDHLDAVAQHCSRVISLIKAWKTRRSAPPT